LHVLNWLYTAISWVLLRWHELFGLFLNANGGWAWTLSIIFLVVTLRLVLFPLFVKQIHSVTAMQKMQPKVAEIKRKYKDDRQAQARAMMELQKSAGVNPLGGCLPLIAQTPVFISLYHVLRHLHPGAKALYGWTTEQTQSAIDAKLFGAPLPASFRSSTGFLHGLHANPTSTRVVILVLLLLSCAATYITQRQSYQRNKDNLEGQQAQIQKFMLYVLPFGLLFTGLVFQFPLGVLLYWVTNNLWTMGQQFYIFERMKKKEAAEAPAPVDTKALAPKPGARPTQPKGARQRANPNQKQQGSGQQSTQQPSQPNRPTKPPTKPPTTPSPAIAGAGGDSGGDGGAAASRPSGGGGGQQRRRSGAKRPSGSRPQRKKRR